MPRWIIITEAGEPVPVGTRLVMDRRALDNGLIRWIVEGEEFMSILPRMVRGIVEVYPAPPQDSGESNLD